MSTGTPMYELQRQIALARSKDKRLAERDPKGLSFIYHPLNNYKHNMNNDTYNELLKEVRHQLKHAPDEYIEQMRIRGAVTMFVKWSVYVGTGFWACKLYLK